MLGGIFEISSTTILPDLSFRSKPDQWRCEGFDVSVFQTAQTMAFAIEEINKDSTLLPNLTLGYRLYDNCVKLPLALRAATTLIGGMEDVIINYDCEGLPPVVAIVGDPVSTHSIAISRMLGLFGMPLVSFYATCSCLSNKQEFPSFFRTIPSDAFQVKVIVEIIKHYGWTWVGIIASEDDYGQYAVRTFHEEVTKYACVAFSETLPKVKQKNKVSQIINTIKQSTAKVIVVFSSGVDLNALFDEVVSQNITGRQWIGSEAWSTGSILINKEKIGSFAGTLGIAIRRGAIPELQNYLLKVRPDFDPKNSLSVQFWESMFDCKFQDNMQEQNSSTWSGVKACTGFEDLPSKSTGYSDVSQLRDSYNVYKAVYALAHALHSLVSCETGKGPFKNHNCANVRNTQPWQLLHYLKKVNFTNHLGERIAFDENGDVLGIYDIINWQQGDDGIVTIKNVGVFDKSALASQELYLDENEIFWNFDQRKVPESVCSKSCEPGTRKATRKGQPVCCFDCIPCADGEISTDIDSIECLPCQPEFWSNHGRNQCIMKEIEFLSYEDSMGLTLTTTALTGVCLSLGILSIFIHYRHTPVVKANNSELSFLLLASLTLCFFCALCFIGQPTNLSCMLRHVMFGISFVLCISCILVKTIVVIMAFKAALPGNNLMKWFGVPQQRGTVFFFTLIQSVICIVWLSTAPPVPNKNTKIQSVKIIFECDVGSLTGFSCLLGYIGFLAGISFILAFLARNLPDSFNEAKFITFSMLIFCAVWITFIPAYISSPGKYTVAVEIFAILASSFGVLFAIFLPKCYIILIKPEKNNKKALMGKPATKK
ncbi:extracellular calcium-sensing receptor-like [Erpetoichthys calabaricus]|uniref:extracellular calcium-sensing receptor-like n=1 Tax=Erpetoichthys calabaricus TaxID=27687 RepID=UPI002234BDE1|nr:extracellular calcium-sensing receptor-like [Erpetoichthys calabaricus]